MILAHFKVWDLLNTNKYIYIHFLHSWGLAQDFLFFARTEIHSIVDRKSWKIKSEKKLPMIENPGNQKHNGKKYSHVIDHVKTDITGKHTHKIHAVYVLLFWFLHNYILV